MCVAVDYEEYSYSKPVMYIYIFGHVEKKIQTYPREYTF